MRYWSYTFGLLRLHQAWSELEDAIIREKRQEGIPYKLITQWLPHRTECQIKNRWTFLQGCKRAVIVAQKIEGEPNQRPPWFDYDDEPTLENLKLIWPDLKKE
jgi:hypothetical protein